MKRYDSGLKGEKLAEDYLCSQGMICLGRRVRAGSGELDLVMQDGHFIVFVQVKYRPSSAAGMGLAAVGQNKRRRMLDAAIRYLIDHGITDLQPRFDAVQITREGILHVPNAFGALG